MRVCPFWKSPANAASRERPSTSASRSSTSRLVVDPKMLGFDVCAYIGIRLQDVSILMQTVDRLKQIPEIVECHFITGTYNLFVKLYCVDNEHLMTTLCDRILAIPGISTTQTYISLNEAFQRQIYVDCLHD